MRSMRIRILESEAGDRRNAEILSGGILRWSPDVQPYPVSPAALHARGELPEKSGKWEATEETTGCGLCERRFPALHGRARLGGRRRRSLRVVPANHGLPGIYPG